MKGLERRYDKYLSKKKDGLVVGKRDVTGTIIRTTSSINYYKSKMDMRCNLNILIGDF